MTLFSIVAVAVTTVASGAESVVGDFRNAERVVDVGDPVALLGSAAFAAFLKSCRAALDRGDHLHERRGERRRARGAFVALFGTAVKKRAFTRDVFRVRRVARGARGNVDRPWRLLGDARGFVWVWLVGHAALLAPVAGVLLADYHVVRRRTLDLDGLYDRTEPAEDGAGGGAYWYGNGTNGVALLAFAFGACFCVPGFLGACGLGRVSCPRPRRGSSRRVTSTPGSSGSRARSSRTRG